MKHFLFSLMAGMLLAQTATAQENADIPLISWQSGGEDAAKVTITPLGRVLVDGALFISRNDGFNDGATLPEARLGLEAAYSIFKAKVELGYSFGTVSPRDMFIEAAFTPKVYMRVGYQLQPFSLNAAYSMSSKSTMEQPVSNAVFETDRSLSALAVFDSGQWFAGASLIIEPKALVKSTDQLGGGTAWGANTRLVWRPLTRRGEILQIGWSGGYMSPQYSDIEEQNHRSYAFSANYPTRVARVTALSATVDNARSMFKFTPELIASYGPVALESQYYFMQVNRRDNLAPYRAYGAYAIVRGLLFGAGGYTYNSSNAFLNPPTRKALELSLCYNYTCLSDSSSDIYGGRLSEVSATLSWYINKYLTWRLRYGFTHTWDRTDATPCNLGAFQTRIQFVF